MNSNILNCEPYNPNQKYHSSDLPKFKNDRQKLLKTLEEETGRKFVYLPISDVYYQFLSEKELPSWLVNELNMELINDEYYTWKIMI